jgi:hypothetical protein
MCLPGPRARIGTPLALRGALASPHEEFPMAPKAWTEKDERQYDKIKQSLRRDGKSPERAKEIAARTVNKTRRAQGRTPNKTTSGTGNPNKVLSERNVQELRNLAKQRGVKGRSGMNKGELVRALQRG